MAACCFVAKLCESDLVEAACHGPGRREVLVAHQMTVLIAKEHDRVVTGYVQIEPAIVVIVAPGCGHATNAQVGEIPSRVQTARRRACDRARTARVASQADRAIRRPLRQTDRRGAVVIEVAAGDAGARSHGNGSQTASSLSERL
jgi:hypothetical protein